MFEWLLKQSRNKNRQESERFRLIDDDVDEKNQSLERVESELLGKGVKNSEPITCGEFPNLIDFHFHVRYVPSQDIAVHLESLESPRRLILHLPYSSEGMATLTENSLNALTFISPRAQNQLDPLGWNDIRLRVEGDRVGITINGFHALDQPLDPSEIQGWKISLEPSGPEDTEMRFRYLRWRPLTWLVSSTN